MSAIDPAIRAAIFGNVGTLLAFRVGAADATFLAREFAGAFSVDDLISVEKYNVYVKLLLDGEPSRPFSAAIPPFFPGSNPDLHHHPNPSPKGSID